MKKSAFLILIASLIVLVAFIGNQGHGNKEASDVLEDAWDKYEIQSFEIGKDMDHPNIWVDVYDESDIPVVEEYLTSNLSNDDLDRYGINVFSERDRNHH